MERKSSTNRNNVVSGLVLILVVGGMYGFRMWRQSVVRDANNPNRNQIVIPPETIAEHEKIIREAKEDPNWNAKLLEIINGDETVEDKTVEDNMEH